MHCHEGRIMERWWRRMHQCKSSQKRRSMCCSHRRWRHYSRKIVWYMSPSQMNLMMLGQGTAQDYGEMAASHGCLQMYERVFSAMNMILLAPLSHGHNAILVIVDKFTKWTLIEGIGMDLTGLGAAQILQDRVFHEHGVPHKVVSDWGPQFVSQFMKEFYAMIGVKANPSTAFHPQTDEQTERVNQEIEVYLHAYIDPLQDDWAEWLSMAEFALNNCEHSATRQ